MAQDVTRPILVTGATGGFGPTLIEHLLREYAVVGMYRSAEAWQKVQQQLGSPAGLHGVAADLTDPAGVAQGLAQIRAEVGPLYGLVHLASGFAGGSVEATELADWNRLLSLNITNAFVAMRAVLPQLRERGGGRIIAIGWSGAAGRPAGLAGYTVGKAGLQVLVEVLAKELKDTAITANIVLPEALATPTMRENTSPGKLVPLERVAATIAFLLSDAAANITGAGIPLTVAGAKR